MIRSLTQTVSLFLTAAIPQFAYEYGKGNVPVPEEWRWLVSVVSTGMMAIVIAMKSEKVRNISRKYKTTKRTDHDNETWN